MPKVSPISLDGSTLEGGGQLVRVAFSLSAITGIPVHIYNIRANRMAKGRSKMNDRPKADVRSMGRAGGGHGDRDGRGKRSGSGKTGGNGTSGGGGGGGNTRKAEGGAKESHLAAILWLARKCGAHIEGAEVGSREITFVPGVVNRGKSNLNAKGAGKTVSESSLVDLQGNVIHLERPGSVCLILQCVLPYLLFVVPEQGERTATPGEVKISSKDLSSTEASAPALNESNIQKSPDAAVPAPMTTELTLHGGTNVDKAMTTDYIQHVFLPMLSRLINSDPNSKTSANPNTTLPQIHLETSRRGWAGSAPQIGEVKVRIAYTPGAGPLRIPAINATEMGDISRLSAVIIAHGEDVRSTILNELTTSLTTVFGPDIPIDVLTNEESGDIRRLYILVIAHTSNGYRLGRDVLGSGRTPKNAAETKRIIGECVKSVVTGIREEIRRGGCVDEFMGDQVVVFQALAGGCGRVYGGEWREGGKPMGKRKAKEEVEEDEDGGDEGEEEVGDETGSLHARTVRWVCERILNGKALGDGRGGVKFEAGGSCTGIGWNCEADGDVVNADACGKSKHVLDRVGELKV